MVYLLCFNSKFKHAKHYIGYCKDGGLDARMRRHRSGHGAKLIKAILSAGIDFVVSRTWDNVDKNFERKLKNRKKSQDLCPICKAAKNAVTLSLTSPTICTVETIEENPIVTNLSTEVTT